MKKLSLLTIVAILLVVAGCKKQTAHDKEESSAAGVQAKNAETHCVPRMYSLGVDIATGFSYIYGVTGSPGAPPITVTPFVGSGGTHQLKTCANVPIMFATGLTYDPKTKIFWGTTGAAGPTPNHIFRFTDPNCVSITPAINSCGLANFNLSDVERDPTTGIFYAINRSVAPADRRVVRLGLPALTNVNCLVAALPAYIHPRGLTTDCSGRLFIMDTYGASGNIAEINPATGAVISFMPYPGAVSPPGVTYPELGLHYDCDCIKRFITGSFEPPAAIPFMTDGLPTAMGGPIYFATPGVLGQTVDFARP